MLLLVIAADFCNLERIVFLVQWYGAATTKVLLSLEILTTWLMAVGIFYLCQALHEPILAGVVKSAMPPTSVLSPAPAQQPMHTPSRQARPLSVLMLGLGAARSAAAMGSRDHSSRCRPECRATNRPCTCIAPPSMPHEPPPPALLPVAHQSWGLAPPIPYHHDLPENDRSWVQRMN